MVESDQADENQLADEDQCIVDVSTIKVGESVKVKKSKLLELKTKAPARFSEPSLITKLEKDGIGRPATYASILSNIIKRGYLVPQGKSYVPSESAVMIVNTLSGKFKFMELEYTKNMEEQLDTIATGQGNYFNILEQANADLVANLAILDSKVPKYPCPLCDAELIRFKSKTTGFFWGCSRYKQGCKHSQPDDNGKPGKKVDTNIVDTKCPACNSAMRLIKGKNGSFLGCTNYSGGCKQTLDCDKNGKVIKLPSCPKCGSNLRKLKGSKGTFWGCSGYKDGCKATFDDKAGKPVLQAANK